LNVGDGRVLARIRSGSADLPGVVEFTNGRGLILLAATSPRKKFGQLMARASAPLMVTLMHELANRASGSVRAWHELRPEQETVITVSPRERSAGFWQFDGTGARIPLGGVSDNLQLSLGAGSGGNVCEIYSELDGRRLATRAACSFLPGSETIGERDQSLLSGLARISARSPVAGDIHSGEDVADLAPLLAIAGLILMAAEIIVSGLTRPRSSGSQELVPAREKRGRAAS
jgi:hypothetical protein